MFLGVIIHMQGCFRKDSQCNKMGRKGVDEKFEMKTIEKKSEKAISLILL